MAVYEWIRYWRPYLWGRTFKVHTDHSPLTGIKTKKDITGRLTNMILKLQEYDYELVYIPGKKNVVADALSREPITTKEKIIAMLEREEDLEEIQIEMGGKEFARWIMSIGKEEEKKKEEKLKTLHQRPRKRAQKNWNEWQERRFHWIGKKEEFSREQGEDESLEEFRQRAIGENRGGLWVVEEDILYRIRKRRKGKEDLQLVVPKGRRGDNEERA